MISPRGIGVYRNRTDWLVRVDERLFMKPTRERSPAVLEETCNPINLPVSPLPRSFNTETSHLDDRLDRIESQLTTLGQSVKEYQMTVKKLINLFEQIQYEKLSNLTNLLAQKEDILNQQQYQLHQERVVLHKVLHSASWKVTRPVRVILKKIREMNR